MRIRSALVTTVALMAAFLMTADAFGQARLMGKVTDKWGNGLPGIQITAEREGGGGSQETVTEDDGEYSMIGLTSAIWQVTFSGAGYQGVRTNINVRVSARDPFNMELEALPAGGRLRGDQEFEAEGGSPKIKFNENGEFEFEDADGEEGEGTYGIVEQNGMLTVRDYDGDDDKYSIAEPIVVNFTDSAFTSLTWDGVTLNKK